MRISEVSKQKVNPTFNAKPIPKKFVQSFKDQLLSKKVKTVDIYCHRSPDEDTVNAMKVMYNWLKRHGKKARACLDTSDTTGLYLNKLFYHIKNKSDKKAADKSLCIDFNGTERIPQNYDLLQAEKNRNNILGLDHHIKTETSIPTKNMYIDDSAASCCGVVYRFFEAIGEKLSKKDLKSLYCGMLSDYKGSKLTNIKKTDSGYELVKQQSLLQDKNSLEILNKIEASLSDKDKNKIYKHLDIMSRLNSNEKLLLKNLAKYISFSTTSNLAYIFIEPNDELWRKVGYDNVRTSAILKDIRTRVMENFEGDELFTSHQKEKFKNLKAIAIFYRVNNSFDSSYQISLHSKDGYAEKLIENVKERNNDFVGGGHPDRAGGRINACDYANSLKLVNDFLEADEELSVQ